MSDRVLIEFTKDTETGRREGERLLVDPMSAKSLVDKKKVAKRVTDKDAQAEAKKAAAPATSPPGVSS